MKKPILISSLAAVFIALIFIGVMFYANGNLQRIILDSKYPCNLNEKNKIMTCPLDSRTISTQPGGVLIDLYEKPYKDYVLSHLPAIINLSAINRDGIFTSALGLCNYDGRYLDCQRNVYDVSLGKEKSVVIYFSDNGFIDTNNFCADEGDEICSDQDTILCENHLLVNKGKMDGKCGYETPKETQAPNNQVNEKNSILDIIYTPKDEVNNEPTRIIGIPLDTSDSGNKTTWIIGIVGIFAFIIIFLVILVTIRRK